MGKIIFITGGARSGKSRFAETLLSGKKDVLYVATALGFDDEMRDRIARHRSHRDPAWVTVECYRDLAATLKGKLEGRCHILFDCVTLMINNRMVVDSRIEWDRASMEDVDKLEKEIRMEVSDLVTLAREFKGETIIVSNELGMGLVPATPLGRHYRDIAGKINQEIAGAADLVYFMISGIPMKVKG
ncbi:MAG: bifunctional adenosylcobinamide kinase/adenosylcobinamide-phosphate guanylyltransferase [Spirochaetes bacterium]|nr:bifunctional adenosylcobinamide kinase/adenosylcobinamide-phosphate guanylyltransferase [Spirochaetota bacterium]